MVTFIINRKTGEEKIIDVYDAPGDNPLKATGALFAEMIVKQGLLEKLKNESEQLKKKKSPSCGQAVG